jgi:hypothetical protein
MSDLYDQAVGAPVARGEVHGDTTSSNSKEDEQARIEPEQKEEGDKGEGIARP